MFDWRHQEETSSESLPAQVAEFYRDLSPAILGGILNMGCCTYLRSRDSLLLTPVDLNLVMPDGRPVFGANKTWAGLVGMIAWSGVSACVLAPFWSGRRTSCATGMAAFKGGAALGLAYTLGELPNSFLKRRLQVAPGRPAEGVVAILGVTLDQVDSVIACLLVLRAREPMPVAKAARYLGLGALTHVIVSYGLYIKGWRRNPL